jgi:hypothetical protein
MCDLDLPIISRCFQVSTIQYVKLSGPKEAYGGAAVAVAMGPPRGLDNDS